jgi:hypothetical protein
MRRAGGGLVAALMLAALAQTSTARAEMTALATRTGNQAPVLVDGRVLWTTRSGKDGIRVFSRLAGGGPVQVVGRATVPGGRLSRSAWSLVAVPGWLGLRVGGRLLGGAPGSQLAPLRSGVPRGSLMADARDTWGTPPGGFVTLERRAGAGEDAPPRDVVVTDARGAHRKLALPPGADPATLSVSGASAAVVIGDAHGAPREVDVLDLARGAVQRRVAMGSFSVASVTALSLSPEGDIAATGEDGHAVDGLAWAPAAATEFDVQTIGDSFGLVAAAQGRIAMVGPHEPGLDGGHRVFVFEPRPGDQAPQALFQSPPANQVEALDFDGAHVAWGIQDDCQLVANAAAADSNLVMPKGPCVRTQVTVAAFVPPKVHGSSVGVQFNCLTAPAKRCRIRVRAQAIPARGGRARNIGVVSATVPRGATRILYVPVSRRTAASLRREKETPLFFYTVIDPDGKRRTDLIL